MALGHLIVLTLLVSWTNAALIDARRFGPPLVLALATVIAVLPAPAVRRRITRDAVTHEERECERLYTALWPVALSFSIFAIVYAIVRDGS